MYKLTYIHIHIYRIRNLLLYMIYMRLVNIPAVWVGGITPQYVKILEIKNGTILMIRTFLKRPLMRL